MMSAVSEFRVRNQLAELPRVGEQVASFSKTHQLPRNVAHAFDLSLTEWITNIISHGYADSREHWIEIHLAIVDDQMRAEIVDDGREFNPLIHPPADTSAPLETRPTGGLGLHMMRQLMDRVEYRREGDQNIVTLTKQCQP